MNTMRRYALSAMFLLAAGTAAQASLLPDDYETMAYTEALERIRGQPERHVMIYFGMWSNCPPCLYTRNLLRGPSIRSLYKASFQVTEVDLRNPDKDGRAAIEKYKVYWAPTLIFLDAAGKVVLRLPKGFDNEMHAILVGEYVSRKLYAKTDIGAYVKANFNATGAQRVVPETRLAVTRPAADERPRLRDVLAQNHQRVPDDQMKKLFSGTRMEKENQDWFLSLALGPDGKLAAQGSRKDGKGKISGPGVWYVSKKGKFCVEVKATGLDETWCRHVFRVGDNYYYAVKDLREKSLAYRFTLEKG